MDGQIDGWMQRWMDGCCKSNLLSELDDLGRCTDSFTS